MNSSDKEKALLGANTLNDFFKSWGDDIHAKILLEILLEGLMNEEALFISGESEQKGIKINHSILGGVDNNIEN